VHDESARDGWRNATRVCLVMLAVTLFILAASGVWLWFEYRPRAASSWPGVHVPRTSESWVRSAHRVASAVGVMLALTTVVLFAGRRLRTRRRGVVAGVGVLVTALAASFTGYLLPWDQLALSAVTVGTEMRGIQVMFDAPVKYVLIGSSEISLDTYRFWAISHVVLGVLVACAVVLAWMRTRSDRASTGTATIAVDQT